MEKMFHSRRAEFARAAAALLLPTLFAACAAPSGGTSESAAYGLSVAAEMRVAGSQQEVAACLRRRANSASYPQGVSPGYTATESEDGALRLTQWFFYKRGATWATHFLLRPMADGATDVQVLLPVELTASEGYRRAAVELVSHCQAGLALK